MTDPAPLLDRAREHRKARQWVDAVSVCRQILDITPNNPEALCLMGMIELDQGHYDQSIGLLQQAIRQFPDPPATAYYSLGLAFHMTDRIEEALIHYDHSLRIRPDYVDALNNHAVALRRIGANAGAIQSYQQALVFAPDRADIYYNLGNVMRDCGKTPEAISLFEKAVDLLALAGPKANRILYSASHNNVGQVYADISNHAKAIFHFEQAIALNPDNGETYHNFANVLHDQGKQSACLASYDKALALKPLYPEARLARAIACIPVLFDHESEIDPSRTEITKELNALERWFDADRLALGHQAVGVSQPFFLAYQERNNRDILAHYGRICVRLMEEWQKSRQPIPPLSQPSPRIRVGFVSSHFHDHSVWNALTKGWLRHLDRQLIETHVFYFGHRIDAETQWAMANTTSFQNISNDLETSVRAIESKNLDILIYPEIGMAPTALKLASLRLVPIQMTSWGHPETSGLPTMDYYLSAEDFEPPEADRYYTEKLVRLPHLGCCYEPLDIPEASIDPATLGINTALPVLLSPGMVFKYGPAHDRVFVEIARRLGACQIVFFIGKLDVLTERFRNRLRAAFDAAGQNFEATCLFIPWQDRPAFYSLLKQSTLFLDTIGFSGFNTAIQAIECGLPVVTREGQFMRGRLGSGILRRMGMPELIASSDDDYIEKAVRLVTDDAYRFLIRSRIIEHRHHLFNDTAPVTGLQTFLLEIMNKVSPPPPPVTILDVLKMARDQEHKKNPEAAEALYRQILAVYPKQPDALHRLGLLASATGRHEEGEALINQAIMSVPDPLDVYYFNLGRIQNILKKFSAACASYKAAIRITPDYADAYANLGATLRLMGRNDEALASLQKAITLSPDEASFHYNLGNFFRHQNQHIEAMNAYQMALACVRTTDPVLHAAIHNNIGLTFQNTGSPSEAISHFQKAIELNPADCGAYHNSAGILRDQGKLEECLAAYQKAMQADPLYVEARWAYTTAHIPLLYDKESDQEPARNLFLQRLGELNQWFDDGHQNLGYRAVGTSQPFFIAYQEKNNRDLLHQYGMLCSRLMKIWDDQQTFPQNPANRLSPPHLPIRVGIISSHFHDHSVWRAITKGWLSHFNPALIETYLFQSSSMLDNETRWAKTRASSFQTISSDPGTAAQTIRARDLDVLIYPDIGMDPLSVKLASLRLCPIQMVSWGHPETSGLPTIDYYLSADDFEPPEADNYYSERLVRLPHLGCCYHSQKVFVADPDLAGLGIRSDAPILMAPGMSFKYAPQHDHVFVDIARALGNCQIVFFISRDTLSERLQKRIRLAFEKAGLEPDKYIVFIPWQNQSAFFGLMHKAKVFLDTIGFSGFNTAIQAIECGLPVVTREGQFMRGRLARGILHRMGMPELIASTNAEYVKKAVQLVMDPDYHASIRNRIIERRGDLFEDAVPVKALENLLLDLVNGTH